MIKILLVDDEPLALEYLENLIGGHVEYTVIGAYTDAMQAIQAANDQKPDIVFTDICMDETDGLQMIGLMREVWGKEILFVAVSGYQTFDYAKRALELGVRDYLLKPVFEKDLFCVLEKLKAEIEEQKNKKEIIEQSVEKLEKVSDTISQLFEQIIASAFSYDVEQAESQMEMLLKELSENDTRRKVWERQILLMAKVFDEKLAHQHCEIQTFCQDQLKKNMSGEEVICRCIRGGMLRIMEESEGYNDQPVSYMQLFICQNYQEDIQLQAFSDKLYMNKAYLGQKFKKVTGMSVNEYLQNIRIREAVRLAHRTALSWQEIALAVGYGSYISFLKYFAKREGVLPSDYKR